MTPRSLFTIILKIMGIYMVISSVTVVPQFVSTLFMFRSSGDGDNTFAYILTLLMLLMILGIFFITLKYCLFKTDWIIDKLALDKHFKEEKFELNIHRSTTLSIAVIVIGGIMFTNSFPDFCRSVYSYVGQKQTAGVFGENPTAGWIIFYFAETFLGYLLMSNYRHVVNLIERQRKK